MSIARRIMIPVRPIWRRAWSKLEARLAPVEDRTDRLEARLAPMDERTSRLESRLPEIETRLAERDAALERLDAGWRQHLPAFLNAVSSIGAFGHELGRARSEAGQVRSEAEQARSNADWARSEAEQARSDAEQAHSEAGRVRTQSDQVRAELEDVRAQLGGDIGRLWERLEFIRREIMFEMKYARDAMAVTGADAPSGNERAVVAPRILAPEKVAAARSSEAGLRINLGCGHVPLEDYINVDLRELPRVDVAADVRNLPFEDSTLREVSSAHLLEHFPQEMLRRNLLPYWRSLLEPGGVFRAIVPDGEAMLTGAAGGTYPFEDFREVLFGAQDYDGDFHFNLFTPASLAGLLNEAGFHGVEVPVRARRNGKCFEFEICARR
jgi:hypothetical protein